MKYSPGDIVTWKGIYCIILGHQGRKYHVYWMDIDKIEYNRMIDIDYHCKLLTSILRYDWYI